MMDDFHILNYEIVTIKTNNIINAPLFVYQTN